jgi:hypothetical protein
VLPGEFLPVLECFLNRFRCKFRAKIAKETTRCPAIDHCPIIIPKSRSTVEGLRNYLPRFFPTFRVIAVISAWKTIPKTTQKGEKNGRMKSISSIDKENILDKRSTPSESRGSLVDP